MAIFHLTLKSFSRGQNQSAVAAAAYRAGVRLWDEMSKETKNFTDKEGVVNSFILLPAIAPDFLRERNMLWNFAEWSEHRTDSRTAREIEVGLPSCLSFEQREQTVKDFCQMLIDRYGVAVDVSIHLPNRQGNERNHHAHIMFTTRAVTATGFNKKKNRILDEPRSGKIEMLILREGWADILNTALKRAGSLERVDHRSHKDRGIDVPPQIHVGVSSTNMTRQGKEIRGSVIKVDFRGREIDYTKIDQGRTRAQHNADIIDLQKYRQSETVPEKLSRINRLVLDSTASIEQLQASIHSTSLSEEIIIRARMQLERLMIQLFLKRRETAFLRYARENQAKKRQLKEQLTYQTRLKKIQAELQEQLKEEQEKKIACQKLLAEVQKMWVNLNGLPPYVIKLEIPLRAQFNEVAYRQNLKTLSSSAIEQALFRSPDKPQRILATLTLRQDVLAIKELLSRSNLPEKGRGRITTRQEFARKRL
jgi:hypothetical protein